MPNPGPDSTLERHEASEPSTQRPVQAAPPAQRQPDLQFSDRPEEEENEGAANSGRLEQRLTRIERMLGDIRAAAEIVSREERHAQFSLPRFAGALLQVIAVTLGLLAAFQWLTGDRQAPIVHELAFAGLAQLTALTSYVIALGERRR